MNKVHDCKYTCKIVFYMNFERALGGKNEVDCVTLHFSDLHRVERTRFY